MMGFHQVESFFFDKKDLFFGIISTVFRDYVRDVGFEETYETLVHPYCYIRFNTSEERILDLRRSSDLKLLNDEHSLLLYPIEMKGLSAEEERSISLRLNMANN